MITGVFQKRGIRPESAGELAKRHQKTPLRIVADHRLPDIHGVNFASTQGRERVKGNDQFHVGDSALRALTRATAPGVPSGCAEATAATSKDAGRCHVISSWRT